MATSSAPALAAQLGYLLGEELRLCERMLNCIRRETVLLEQHDHETYLSELPGKHALVNDLQAVAAQRDRLVQLEGYPTLDSALQAVVTDSPADAEAIQPLRSALGAMTHVCALENRQLGQLIQRQSRFFDFLLNNMLPGRQDGLTYHQDGSRPIGTGVGRLVTV